MKIAFVTPAYYPAIIGASLYCQTLAYGLKEKGYDVVIYSNSTPNCKKKEIVKGILVKRFYPKIIGSYYISDGMFSSLMKDDFDLIHSHHYGYYPATAGFIAAKLKKLPHLLGPYYHPPVYGLRRSLLFAAYHLTQGLPLLRFSDVVLPHTNFEKKMLLKVGGKRNNMKILPNTVDTDIFKPGRKGKIVLFVNNFIREKGADIAFDLAERITSERKDVRFVFIGSPHDKSFHPRIKKLRRNRNIIFLKNLPLHELVKWYKRSLIFILPSRYEAFSRATAEAEACGCAALATNVGGLPEVINNGDSGFLVNYGEWKRMKEHIEYLLDNPKVARKMGARGRRHVEKNFDSRVVVKRLVKLYEGLI